MNSHNDNGQTPAGPIGDALAAPTWPVYVWSAIWTAWLLFLLFMVVQR